MELIWSTVLTVWGWLLDHLLYINLAFSIIIIFFQRRDPRSVWTWLLACTSSRCSESSFTCSLARI